MRRYWSGSSTQSRYLKVSCVVCRVLVYRPGVCGGVQRMVRTAEYPYLSPALCVGGGAVLGSNGVGGRCLRCEASMSLLPDGYIPPPPHRLPSHVAVIRFCIFATINRMYTQGSAYYADIPCTINSRACLHLQDGLSMLASHVFYVPRHLPHEVEADTKSGKVATYLTFG